MSGFSPSWAETTVRWLRQKRSRYIGVGSAYPFSQQLESALYQLDFIGSDDPTAKWAGTIDERNRFIADMVSSWDERRHHQLVGFVDARGRARPSKKVKDAVIDIIKKEISAKMRDVLAPSSTSEVVSVRGPAGESLDVEIELDGSEQPEQPETGRAAGAMTEDDELAEILAASDLRKGAW